MELKNIKVKTISRSEAEYTKSIASDIIRVHRNIDPSVHPFERSREYTRALNAVKLDKVFAKPFIGDLNGHKDGVFCMARHPQHLPCIMSGSCDGEIRIWNVSYRSVVWSAQAHTGFVRGLALHSGGSTFLSCGDDLKVKIWNLDWSGEAHSEEDKKAEIDTDTKEPINTFLSKHAFTAIDCQRKSNLFATAGTQFVDLWDIERSSPVKTFEWGHDTVTTLRFNPAEVDILASAGTDRSITLYDLRGQTPIRKVIMNMRSNSIAWNPMEPFVFTFANEDHNLYTFDMRKLEQAIHVHKDHLSAVLDVDYSPTGKEFCSGSYDRTIRIFNSNESHSRDVYHTKRMQRIFCVKFSGDGRFVLSGSDDTNIRIWKSQASQPLGVLNRRKQSSLDYQNALKKRFQHAPEIKRISRHRHLPKALYSAKKLKKVMDQADRRKFINRVRHSRPGSVKSKPEKEASIVKQIE